MEEQPQELDIQRYLHIIYKKRYLAIAVAVGIITLVIAASYIRTPSYEVFSTVSVEKNYLNVLMQDFAVASEEGVQALSAVMLSRGMILRVMSELEVDLEAKSEADIEKLVKHFQKATKIKVDTNRASKRNMELFTVFYSSSDPRFARDYVNALINRYIVESMSSKRQDAVGANRFVMEQMNRYKGKIDQIESELTRRPKERGTTARLSALQKKYEELLVQYTEQHPEIVRLKAEIESTRELIQQDQSRGRNDKSGQNDSAGDVVKTRKANDGKRKSTADLERDRDAYKKIYESLAASLGRSEVSAQVEVMAKADTFRVLEPAVLPIEPAGAPRWKIILLGIVAGIAGGAGIAIVLDMMDKSIKSVDTLKYLGLPVIGMIPQIRNAAAIVATRKMDRLVYSAAGLYLFVVVVLAVVEFLK
jgi:polysaccharide biosynthesis transport protein